MKDEEMNLSPETPEVTEQMPEQTAELDCGPAEAAAVSQAETATAGEAEAVAIKKRRTFKEYLQYRKKKKRSENRSRFTPLTVFLLVVLLLYAAVFILLLLWAVSASLKINQSVFDVDPYRLFPRYNYYKNLTGNDSAEYTAFSVKLAEQEGSLLFYSYRNIVNLFYVDVPSTTGGEARKVYMAEMYLYSFLYAGGCALTNTIVPCVVAYCCARFKYKFSKFIHTLVIVTMIIPIVGSLPSEIKLANNLGIFNTIWGLWIMKANFLGLYFLVFYDIFKGLPDSIMEAARIDGANNFQIFLRIAMPLIRNTFFTVLLIKFITFWNDYQTPAVFMGSYPTVSKALNTLMNQSLNVPGSLFVPSHIPARMATVVLTATPVFVLYVVFQKRLLGNLTMGGVKG